MNYVLFVTVAFITSLVFTVSTALADGQEKINLQELMRQAVRQSPALGRARAERSAAKYEADRSLSAFAPMTQVSGTFRRLSEEVFPELAPGVVFPQFLETYSFQASVSIPVIEYISRRPALYKIVHLTLDLEEAQLAEQTQVVAETVASRAFTLIASREAAEVMRQGLKTLNGRITDLSRLVNAGASTKSAILALEAQVAALESELIQVEGMNQLMELELALALGYGERSNLPRFDFDISKSLLETRPRFDQAFGDALSNRPELKALDVAQQIQENQRRLHFSGQFPSFSIDGNIETANPNNRIFPPSGEFETTWAIQAVIAWSPNAFLTEMVRTGQAKVAIEALEEDMRGLKNMVKLQVSGALSELTTASRLTAAAEKRVRAARAALIDQEILRKIGESTAQNLLESEQTKREAEMSFIDAQVKARIAELRMKKAVGRLTEFVTTEE